MEIRFSIVGHIYKIADYTPPHHSDIISKLFSHERIALLFF